MKKRSTHYPLQERAAAGKPIGDGAERLLKGRDAEGSFGAGNALSPLEDRTLMEVAETGRVQACEKRWYRADCALC